MKQPEILLASALLLSSVVLGCGGSGPSLNYVEGVVTVDGNPMEGITVGFSPIDPAKGKPAIGTTNAQGVFKLTSTQGGKPDAGAVAGDYAVTFSKSAGSALSADEVKKLQSDPNYGKSGGGKSAAPSAKSAIPKEYADPAKSGIKATVKPGKNTGDELKFDLKSDFKGAGK
jgi:hypothetical protein